YINSTLTEWDMFRLMAFDHFKTNFVDRPIGQGRTIPLAFNIQSNLQSETDNAQNWVNLNIGDNYGIKGSAFVRAHHLTGEKEFKEEFYSNLVNPKELALFSRAEFDQTWRRPYVLTNLRLGIYWGMLGGLNTGLSLWDWTLSGVQAANGVYDSDVVVPLGGEHRESAEEEFFGNGSVPGRNGAYTLSDEILKTIDFFNAHAGQIYPQVATSAYSIFHKGLNSNNAIEFPVPPYTGPISKSNTARYQNICFNFGNGAAIGDAAAVVKGQVAQRKEQIAYNDSGWDIHEGNYERWIEQIDPDQTSNALYRLNPPLTPASPVYDRFARSVGNASGADKMYFKFNDEVFDNSLPSQITFRITWLDNGAEWRLRYDDGSGGLDTAHSETGVNDGQWKTTQAITVNTSAASGAFNQGGPLGSDFVIRNISSGSTDAIFHGIEVTEIIRHDSVSTHVLNPVPNNEYVIGEEVEIVSYAHNDTEISSVDIQVAGGSSLTATGPGKSQIHWFTVDSLPAPDANGFVNIDSSMTDTASNTIQAMTLALDVDANKAIIRSPAEGATFSSGDPVKVTVVGHHDNGIEKMRFRVQTNGVWGPYNNVNDVPYEYVFENLSMGQHILQVQMKSNAVGGSFERIDSQNVTIEIQ
ncbi:MAG: Ig-like domain-containing protein, partial [Verrucomicrobiota bacterium]